MSMPGFTAETSVYQTKGRYRAILTAPSGLPGGEGVLPQLPIGFCMSNCDDQYEWGTLENSACKFDCMGGGDDGGGGGGLGGGGVDLSCARCIAGCAKKPPAQRAGCRQLCQENVC